MKNPTLAPVYLDNEPVGLLRDPKPKVSKVLAASGQHPESFEIRRLRYAQDTMGKTLALDFVIDRTEAPTQVIYLTCVDKAGSGKAAAGKSAPLVAPTEAPSAKGVSSKLDTKLEVITPVKGAEDATSVESKAALAKPEAAKPALAKPEAAKPDLAKPSEAAKPAPAKPAASANPALAKAAASAKPALAKPGESAKSELSKVEAKPDLVKPVPAKGAGSSKPIAAPAAAESSTTPDLGAGTPAAQPKAKSGGKGGKSSQGAKPDSKASSPAPTAEPADAADASPDATESAPELGEEAEIPSKQEEAKPTHGAPGRSDEYPSRGKQGSRPSSGKGKDEEE